MALHYVSIKDFHLPLQQHGRAAARGGAEVQRRRHHAAELRRHDADRRTRPSAARRSSTPATSACRRSCAARNPTPCRCWTSWSRSSTSGWRSTTTAPRTRSSPRPTRSGRRCKDHDERIGLCIDVGHTARAGVDPAEAIRKYKARLYDVHFKDVVRTDRRGTADETEVGRGVLDIRGMLKALLEIDYAHHVGFEHEQTPKTRCRASPSQSATPRRRWRAWRREEVGAWGASVLEEGNLCLFDLFHSRSRKPAVGVPGRSPFARRTNVGTGGLGPLSSMNCGSLPSRHAHRGLPAAAMKEFREAAFFV